jgi:hypothetical protein
MDGTRLLLSSLFSLIGMAVCVYGRRQRLIIPTILGIALTMYPYFVDSTLALVAIGALLVAGAVMGARAEG